jgi:phosphotransferase system HPr-like phosphotransfer protein
VQGAEIKLKISGADEKKAMKALISLIDNRFEEEE